ncbi:MAG: hypothetical protein WA999_03715, partial [Spirulinaceae cyanobacterium]
LLEGKVNLDGTADPGSQIDIYQVLETENNRGPLNKSIATVTADAKGRFALTLTNQSPGTKSFTRFVERGQYARDWGCCCGKRQAKVMDFSEIGIRVGE